MTIKRRITTLTAVAAIAASGLLTLAPSASAASNLVQANAQHATAATSERNRHTGGDDNGGLLGGLLGPHGVVDGLLDSILGPHGLLGGILGGL